MSHTTTSSAEQALRDAIQIESRNANIYQSLASMFEGYNEDVTRIFNEMAVEEREHGDLLRERYQERYPRGDLPQAGDSQPNEVIEAPELPDSEAFVFDTMSVRQALEAGLRAEKEAQHFYQQVILTTTELLLRQTYEELSQFEDSHVEALESKLAELDSHSDTNKRGA